MDYDQKFARDGANGRVSGRDHARHSSVHTRDDLSDRILSNRDGAVEMSNCNFVIKGSIDLNAMEDFKEAIEYMRGVANVDSAKITVEAKTVIDVA